MSAKLQEIKHKTGVELRLILEGARVELRGTEQALDDIPDAMIGNGAAKSIRTILSLLAKTDDHFVTALKSINEIYGDVNHGKKKS